MARHALTGGLSTSLVALCCSTLVAGCGDGTVTGPGSGLSDAATIDACGNGERDDPFAQTAGFAFGREASSRLSYTVTSEELAMWRDRAVHGPYLSPSGGWPGDWERITSFATEFTAGGALIPQPSEPVTTSTPQLDQTSPEGRLQIRKMMACAFYALVADDAERATEAAEHLYLQLTTGYDYRDTSIWLLEDNDGGGHAPWFQYASNGERIALTLDYLMAGGFASDELISEARSWLHAGARQSAIFVSGKLGSLEGRFEDGSWDDLNGIEPNGARECNNRILDITSFATTAGVIGEYPAAVDAARDFARACIRAAYDPDAQWWADVHRGSDSNHLEVGYGGAVLGHILKAADIMARQGDTALLAYTSPEGRTLLGWSRMWAELALGDIAGPPGLSSTSDLQNVYPSYIYLAQIQPYFQDGALAQVLEMEPPTNPASNGPCTVWEASSGTLPGVLFMFDE